MKLSSIITMCIFAACATLLFAQTTPAPQKTDKVPAGTTTAPAAGCPIGMRGGMGMQGMGRGRGMGMRNGMGMGGNMADHTTIHSLMADHASVKRNTTDVSNGVCTETTSAEPEVAAKIRVHVRQMYTRLEKGQPIRMFDPLFREVFANADKIEMKIDDIPGGVRVTETSKDPNVVLLIRQHARAVDGFTAEGMAKMHEPTALPDGYKPSK